MIFVWFVYFVVKKMPDVFTKAKRPEVRREFGFPSPTIWMPQTEAFARAKCGHEFTRIGIGGNWRN